MKPTLLLDAAALLNHFSFPFRDSHSYYTTNKVMDEFKDINSRTRAQQALAEGKLHIREPESSFLRKATESAHRHSVSLSAADLEITALALQLHSEHKNPKVLTDDYSLQKLLRLEKIPFESVLQPGISR